MVSACAALSMVIAARGLTLQHPHVGGKGESPVIRISPAPLHNVLLYWQLAKWKSN